MKGFHALGVVLALIVSSLSSRADGPKHDVTTVKEILEKATSAIGDQATHDNMKCSTWSTKGQYIGNPTIKDEESNRIRCRRKIVAEFSDKMRILKTIKVDNNKLETDTVVVGDEIAQKQNGMNQDVVIDWQNTLDGTAEYWASRITPLFDEKRFGVTREEDSRVDDEDVYVLGVAIKQGPYGQYKIKEMKLFISKKSGLLLKITRKIPRTLLPYTGDEKDQKAQVKHHEEVLKSREDSQLIVRETIFSDFKKTDGLTMPMKVKITKGGKFEEEYEVTEIKHSKLATDGAFELK